MWYPRLPVCTDCFTLQRQFARMARTFRKEGMPRHRIIPLHQDSESTMTAVSVWKIFNNSSATSTLIFFLPRRFCSSMRHNTSCVFATSHFNRETASREISFFEALLTGSAAAFLPKARTNVLDDALGKDWLFTSTEQGSKATIVVAMFYARITTPQSRRRQTCNIY